MHNSPKKNARKWKEYPTQKRHKFAKSLIGTKHGKTEGEKNKKKPESRALSHSQHHDRKIQLTQPAFDFFISFSINGTKQTNKKKSWFLLAKKMCRECELDHKKITNGIRRVAKSTSVSHDGRLGTGPLTDSLRAYTNLLQTQMKPWVGPAPCHSGSHPVQKQPKRTPKSSLSILI